MKKYLLSLLTLTLLLCEASFTGGGMAFATPSSLGNGVTWEISGTTLTIGYEGEGSGVMPDYSFSNYTGRPWNSSAGTIKTIYFDSGVTTVGAYAFKGFTALTSITYRTTPERTIAKISAHAFDGCTSLTSVRIPQTVTICGDGAYYGCTKLKTVYWDAVNCTKYDATNNFKSNYGPFYDSTTKDQITTFTFGSDVEVIPLYACYNMHNLSKITIPKKVTEIGNYAFQNCTTATSLSIPPSVETIGTSAFSGCTGLTSIFAGPSTPPTTQSNSFASVTTSIPVVVASSSYSTATGWTGFTNISTKKSGTCGTSAEWELDFENGKLSITGSGDMADYTSSSLAPWAADTAYVRSISIAKTITKIGNYAFYKHARCTSVSFVSTSTVSAIGDYAFYGCTGLTSISLPTSLLTIGTYAFQSCTGLTSISLPSKITSVGNYAYDGCSNATSLSLGSNSNSSRTIGNYAFQNCSKVTSITINACVTSIGNYAFKNCSKATTLTFGSSSNYPYQIASIGTYAFQGCGITSVTLPPSVTTLGMDAFQDCLSLKTADFSAATSLTTFGNWMFANDAALTSVILPPNVEDLKASTFRSCTSLETIIIPASVIEVSNQALYGCSALKTIVAYPTSTPTLSSAITNPTPGDIRLAVFTSAAKTAYKAHSYWGQFDVDTKIEGECGASGDNITYALDLSTGVLTLTGSGAMATYSTSDRAPWYQYRSIITSVVVGSGITGIGAYAFKDCANITTASLPASLTSIGSSAFDGCSASTFTSYSYAGTITQWLGITFNGTSSNPMNYVKKCFMNGSTEVNALEVPNGTTSIPNYAFYNCLGLTSVTLPASLSSIGDYAFSSCTNIASVNYYGTIDEWCSITFGTSTSNPAIFSHSLQISGVEQTTIYLSDELEEIKNYAFYSNTTLTEISLKNTTSMAANSLYGCTANLIVRGEVSGDINTGLHWSLLDGVLTISKVSGEGVMADFSTGSAPWYPYRSTIRKIVVAEGVTKIGKYAFQSITNSCGVYLPTSLANINDYGFYMSSGISYIVSANTSAPTVTDRQTNYSSYGSDAFTSIPTATPIYVPAGSTTTYSTAYTSPNNTSAGWRRFSNFLPYTGTCGATGNEENVIWTFDPGTGALTISGTGAMADFANSTSMPWNNFKTNITSVVIESGVTNIGQYAFYGCTNLASLTIPSSVTSFKTITYNNCSSLTTVNYLGTANQWASCTFAGSTANPIYMSKSLQLNGVTLTTCTLSVPVKDYAFYEDNDLQTIVLADGCTSVGEQAFYYCKNLKDVTISSDVAEFKTSAFSLCSALDKENEGSVNYLGTANQWASITFASSNSNPVYNAKSLKLNGTTLTNCTLSVPVKEYAFYNEKDLESLTLDEGATSIASNAFYGCSKLEIIGCAASANLASIGSSAFSGCSALADITLPASLQEVGSSAFNSCSALNADANVNFLGTLNQWASITFASSSCNPASLVHKLKINGDVVNSCSLSVPVKAYTFADNTSLTSLTLNAGCTSIGTYAFSGCSNLAGTIAFPSTLTEIASQAFRSCTSISGLDFSQASSLETLGSSAFYGCTNIAGELHFPASLSSIAGNVFQNITGITAIYANRTEAPTDLNSYTFNSVSKSIPFYVTSAAAVSNYADAPYWQEFTNMFYYGYCGAEGNEENVIWAYNPTTGALNIFGTGAMEDYALFVFAPWYDLRASITSVSIGEGITRIGVYAFRDCVAMTSVALPASITEIGDRAFDGCSGLASYTYAGTVNNWLNITFEYFSSNPMYYVHKFYVNDSEEVTNLVIPNGMTTVKDNAFRACTGLTSLSLPASITTLTGAFTGCTGLTSYSYAGSVADWLHISITNADGNPMKYVHKFMVNGNEEVTDLVIPEGITSISQFAFNQCSGLTSVTIPASLSSIGLSAFSSCSNIADVNYLGTISQWCAINFENNIANPAWFSQKLSINGVEQINIYLPDELPEIKNYVFGKNTTAATISVNNSTTIQAHAFDNCTAEILYRGNTGGETADGLSWSLVDGLLTISGTGAMQNYSETTTPWYPYRSAITGIVVDEGVTAIGSSAFVKTSATSVLIASTVGSIGDWAFSECTSLTQITCNSETPPTIMDGQDGPGSYSSRTFKDIPVDIVVMVPIGSTSAYQASLTDSHNTTSGWARFTNYHEPAVTDIDIIDSENNGVTLTTYDGQEMTVHLTRTIISASYNTICLPFAMTAAQVETYFGANCDIEELTRASCADGNLKLFFTKRTAIEAGKPYLIQPQSDVANPVIADVTIDNTARPSVFAEGVTFTGIFSPTVLANSDNLLFLGASNTLYMSSGGTMKGMRGYFQLTTPQAQAAARRSARIILHEEGATGIEETITNDQSPITNKIIRDGQLFILRDGKTYNAQGALIK